MPILNNKLVSHAIAGSNYGFSAKRIGDLGASEYTLVALAADNSGSVVDFLGDIEECVKDVVLACYRSPRADNLMLRILRFDDAVEEVHGFKPLPECHPADYDHCLKSGGCTALYDAAHNAVASVARYGESLARQNFDVNAILFVITDGMDNASSMTAKSVKQALDDALRAEHLESITTVLVGVGVQSDALSDYLKNFSVDVGFDGYIQLAQADESSLAALAAYTAKSISLQSQALGSGLKSKLLSF